jgi:acetoin utilization protein AcuB
MRVKDLMSRCPVVIGPTMPVLEAYRLMQAQRVRHLLVLDHGRLAGIVSDRDIRLNMAATDIRLNMPATPLWGWELEYMSTQLTAGQVMTRHLIVVESAHDASAAAALLLSEKIDALPVVDDGLLVGIVTASDFVRAFIEIAQPAA